MSLVSFDNEQIRIADFFLRTILGILFFFQGYDKLFNLKLNRVIETFQQEFESKRLPRSFHVLAAYFSSYAEFIGGALLFLGLFRTISLYILGLDLILVTIAFSFVQPVWDMRHVFPRVLFLFLLLLIPPNESVFSFDYLINSFFK